MDDQVVLPAGTAQQTGTAKQQLGVIFQLLVVLVLEWWAEDCCAFHSTSFTFFLKNMNEDMIYIFVVATKTDNMILKTALLRNDISEDVRTVRAQTRTVYVRLSTLYSERLVTFSR